MFGSRRIASAPGIEEARQALLQAFLPVDFPSARASGTVGLTLNAVMVGRITAGFMRFGDALRIDTAEAENYHVDIPVTGSATHAAALATPIHATSQTAAVFMPGRPVRLDTGERFSASSPHGPARCRAARVGEPPRQARNTPVEFTAALNMQGAGGQMIMHALRLIDRRG